MDYRGTSSHSISTLDGQNFRNRIDHRYVDRSSRADPQAPPRRQRRGRSLSQTRLSTPDIPPISGFPSKDYDRDAFAFNYFNDYHNSTLMRHASSEIAYMRSPTPLPLLPMSPVPVTAPTHSPSPSMPFSNAATPHSGAHYLPPMSMSPPPYVEDETQVKKVWPLPENIQGTGFFPMRKHLSLDTEGLLLEKQRAADKYHYLKEKVDEKYFNRATSSESVFPLMPSAGAPKEELFRHLVAQQRQIQGLQQQQQFLQDLVLSNNLLPPGSTPSPDDRQRHLRHHHHSHHHHSHHHHQHQHQSRDVSPAAHAKSSSREKIHQQIQKQQEQVAKHIKQLQEQLAVLRERRASKEAANKSDGRGIQMGNENSLKPIDKFQNNNNESRFRNKAVDDGEENLQNSREQLSINQVRKRNKRGLSASSKPSYSKIASESSIDFDSRSSQVDSESFGERWMSEEDYSVVHHSEEEDRNFQGRQGSFKPVSMAGSIENDLMPYMDDEEYPAEREEELNEERMKYEEEEYDKRMKLEEEERQEELMRAEEERLKEIEERRRRQQEEMTKAEEEMIKQQQLFMEQQKRLMEQQQELETQRRILEQQQKEMEAMEAQKARQVKPSFDIYTPNSVQKPPRKRSVSKLSTPMASPLPLENNQPDFGLQSRLAIVNQHPSVIPQQTKLKKRSGSIKGRRAPDPPVTGEAHRNSAPQVPSKSTGKNEVFVMQMHSPQQFNQSHQPVHQINEQSQPNLAHLAPHSDFKNMLPVCQGNTGSKLAPNTTQGAQLLASQNTVQNRSQQLKGNNNLHVATNNDHSSAFHRPDPEAGKLRPPKPARRRNSNVSVPPTPEDQSFQGLNSKVKTKVTEKAPSKVEKQKVMDTLVPSIPPRHRSSSPHPVKCYTDGKPVSADPYMDHFDHYFSPKAVLTKKMLSPQPSAKSSKENLTAVPKDSVLTQKEENKTLQSVTETVESDLSVEQKVVDNTQTVIPEDSSLQNPLPKEEAIQFNRRQTLPDVITVKEALTTEKPQAKPMVEKPKLVRKKSLPSNTNSPPMPPPGWERERVSALAHEAREARYREAQEGRKISWSAIKDWLLSRQLIIIILCLNLYIAYYFFSLFQPLPNTLDEGPE